MALSIYNKKRYSDLTSGLLSCISHLHSPALRLGREPIASFGDAWRGRNGLRPGQVCMQVQVLRPA